MSAERINRVSAATLIGLALIALVTVLIGLTQVVAGVIRMPEPDEGTGAHIFQLSVGLTVPCGLLYLATADWAQPRRSARPLAIAGVLLMVAFSTLYYMEQLYPY